MKPRPPRRRKAPAQDVLPRDVPETRPGAAPEPDNVEPADENLPDAIRRMLEAAYT